MAGTMILTDTMGRTFDGLFDTANKGVDVVVRRASTVDAGFDGMDVRERVDTATLNRIKAIDGVDTAVGSISGMATLVAPDGKAAAAGGMGGTMGVNWVEDARLNPFAIATGHAPRAPDEVVLDQSTVNKDGRKLGDKVTVLGKGDPRTLTLVGTATFGDADGIPGSTLVATTDATAQALFAEPGAYDSVVIASNGKQTPEALSARVGAALGTERFETLTGAADTANNKADLKEGLGFFSTFLLAFAYISLFVGMFIIYNTFSIVVAQRSKEMAMLRAIGASRRQVVKSVLFESIAVGLVASAVGLGVGVLMSFGLRALLSAVGLDIPGGSVVITPKTVITAFLVGSIVTVLSALAPALRASKVKPIAALRDMAVDNSGASLRRTVIGMIITGAGVTAFAAGVVGSGGGALSMLGVGAVVTIIGVFVLGPGHRPARHGCARHSHRPALRDHRTPGRRERQAKPQADLGHRLGPHDRGGPGELHHHPGHVDQGVGVGHDREVAAGRLRDRFRQHEWRRPQPHAGRRGGQAAAGGGRLAGPLHGGRRRHRLQAGRRRGHLDHRPAVRRADHRRQDH